MALLKTYTISTDITAGAVNSNRLHKELSDAGDITNFTGIIVQGDSLKVLGDSFITEANVDTTVLNHVAITLADNKATKNLAIDTRTVQLIGAGFTYDSKTFSLSTSAQMNWVGLKTLESLFTWPVDISTKDDNEYSLVQANLDAFLDAGRLAIQGHLDSGRTLKVSVADAVDQTALDAVTDTR